MATGDDVDFEAAEKAAKEEAERIEKLGYDPDAGGAENATESSAAAISNNPGPEIVSPTPISPARGGFGAASKGHDRNPAEIERLGMGIGKLGFGQVGSNKSKSAGGAKKLGFGATGGSRASTQDGEAGLISLCPRYLCTYTLHMHSISSLLHLYLLCNATTSSFFH